LLAQCAHSGGRIGGGEAVGRGGKGDQRLDDAAHPCLVEVDATNEGLANLCGERELETGLDPLLLAGRSITFGSISVTGAPRAEMI
jgi:hypothetical protein